MKRIISAALIVFLLTADALAAGIDSIIPDASLWGISRKALQKTANVEYTTMEIGKTKVLHCSGIEIDDILMDAYYVFDYSTWDSTGFTYNGLSKIVYLLTDCKELDLPALRGIRQQFIAAMTKYKGEPDSTAEVVSTWNMADCKIDIGIGTFKKYTGSKHKNVAIVFSGVEIPKPVTPPPTPVPTPVYTYIPPTPKPSHIPWAEYPKLNYDGASRYPDNYKDQYVKFTGVIMQVIENPTLAVDGVSLFYDYELIVHTKKDRWGDYSDDNVYVYINKKDIKGGGRLLEDEKIRVYGQYGGIESYTGGIVSHTISIPRIYANHLFRP